MTAKTFFLAVNTGYAVDEQPSEEALRFYAERSGLGLYCAIVGNVVLPSGFGTNDVCMRISTAPSWRALAQAIQQQGAIPGIQLSSTWPGYKGMRSFKVRRGEDPLSGYRRVANAMTPKDISHLFSDLTKGSDLAIAAGFRHIQLHAAHGYLFCLLLDQYFSRHIHQVLDQTHAWLVRLEQEGVESSVRISLTSGNAEVDKERRATIDHFCALPANFIDVSDGYYNFDKHLIYPSKSEVLEPRHEATMSLAQRFPAQQFILSGRAGLVELSSHKNMHLGFCRDLIANPSFLVRRELGCRNRMKCHFYSTGRSSLTCGLWPHQ